MFCGAGGSSLGAHHAGVEVFLALNHWRLAIETHNANFPDTLHDCADVSATDPRRYPSTTILLASPECTHHTYASGRRKPSGQMDLFNEQKIDPTAERSRATMWDVPRFAEHHNYDIVIIENVVEARKWAPFNAWLHAMDSLGYAHKVVYLNSMFFPPTPQSRDRMYVVFWKRKNHAPQLDYRPVAYCAACERNVEAVQAWNNPSKPWGRWGRYRFQYVYRCPHCTGEVMPYYYAAANAIDWSDLGERIGDRSRPLQPKTIKRIQLGLEKYGNQSPLIQLAYGHAQNNRSTPVTDAVPTQSTIQSVALLGAPWLASVNYFRPDHSVDEPFPTQTTGNQYAVVSPAPFFLGYANGQGPAHGLDEALLTQFGSNAHALITPAPFMVAHYSPGWARGLDEPTGSVTTSDHHSIVTPPFLVQLRNNQTTQGIDEAISTVTAGGGHHALLTPAPFLASYYGSGGQINGIDSPVATVTGIDKHALVTPGDPPALEDCFFRMLQPHEIGRAMAFPGDYVVRGNKRDQVKQFGNAVTPPPMEWLVAQAIRTLM